MRKKRQDLSSIRPEKNISAKGVRIGLVVSKWNMEITKAMADAAVESLIAHGIDRNDIVIAEVPGSFELTAGSKYLAQTGRVDAIICLGCVIQGETPHFDYICQGISYGITQLNIEFDIPFIFGVLTTNTFEQALARSGGKHGNKGVEAAITAINMLAMKNGLDK